MRPAELAGNPISLEMAVFEAAMQLQTLLGIGRCHAQALIQGGQAIARALALAAMFDEGFGVQQACACPGRQQDIGHPFVKITVKISTDRARHGCTARAVRTAGATGQPRERRRVLCEEGGAIN